ncbi:hypothetical protein [Phnomibacter ginsenosidimutans]|uniref:Uncharacterized protein n=1 Tax=Phnomibacter ginsenosidimutans TaxID=2676868 RepID=A0A6I6GQI2_9BACT|nr:hypothetical protein [Phnomibacter ginsenosidimutans]QGW29192.1 hypothetical protein GLV81_14710 [Phnomibacter ginsenosidimutans]
MYYKIIPTSNLRIIGKHPQIETGHFPVNLDSDPRSSKNFWFQEADIEKMVFPEPIVNPKSNLTDYMPCSFAGTRSMPLVSKQLMEFLKSVADRKVQFIPSTVWHNSIAIDDYFYMNCYESSYELVDFEKTTIRWSTISSDKRNNQLVKVDNLNSFLELERTLKPPLSLCMDPIYFNRNFSAEFFFLSRVSSGWAYYVSDEVKSTIINKGFTGLEFIDANQIC